MIAALRRQATTSADQPADSAMLDGVEIRLKLIQAKGTASTLRLSGLTTRRKSKRTSATPSG